MKQKTAKGEYGYLDERKIRQLLSTLFFMLIVAVMFFTGYIRYHHTKSIFTVLAVVSVLPAAKQAVIYIVLFPFRSPNRERYLQIKEIADTCGIRLISDLVLTAQEAVSGVDFICIKEGHLLCYLSDRNTKTDYVEKYIRDIVSPKYHVNAVKSFRDFDKYKKAVKALKDGEAGRYDRETAALILSYCV